MKEPSSTMRTDLVHWAGIVIGHDTGQERGGRRRGVGAGEAQRVCRGRTHNTETGLQSEQICRLKVETRQIHCLG